MICECGNILSDNAAFCSRCGKKAEKQEQLLFCANCGRKITSDAIFCDSCGNRVKLQQEQAVNGVVEDEVIFTASDVAVLKGNKNIAYAQGGSLELHSSRIIYTNSVPTSVKVKEALGAVPFMFGAIGGLVSAGVGAMNDRKQKSKADVKIDDIVIDYKNILYVKKSKHLGVPVMEIMLKNGEKYMFKSNFTKNTLNEMLELTLSKIHY